jgi:phosphatidylinositol alpha-1,6-mannosyltransferase
MLGRVDKNQFQKGHSEMIDSWGDVTSVVPHAQLVIAGGGSGLEYLRSMVQASPARNSIHVRGFVPEAEMERMWSQAHVFAMPSRREGFGLVYVEAMRHSLPVIASVHDAGREVNVDGKTGFNVNLDKRGELAERLISLLASPDMAHRMGQEGHRRWQEHFRFSAFRDRLNPLLGRFLV